MKVFLSIKFHEDSSNRALIEKIISAIEANGCEAVCVIRDIERWGEHKSSIQELMQQTFDLIGSCDVVVVDLSEKGVGIGIEAGYACAMGKPIWVIARSESELSETLLGIAKTVRTYEDAEELSRIFFDLIKSYNKEGRC
jgi:nucleoside 2-deoxyribosyltransferase